MPKAYSVGNASRQCVQCAEWLTMSLLRMILQIKLNPPSQLLCIPMWWWHNIIDIIWRVLCCNIICIRLIKIIAKLSFSWQFHFQVNRVSLNIDSNQPRHVRMEYGYTNTGNGSKQTQGTCIHNPREQWYTNTMNRGIQKQKGYKKTWNIGNRDIQKHRKKMHTQGPRIKIIGNKKTKQRGIHTEQGYQDTGNIVT